MVVIRNTYDGGIIKEFPELDTLAGADLSYEDLMFADFRGMDLSGTDFHGAELYGAEFDDDVFDMSFDAPNFTDTYYEIVDSGAGASGGNHSEFRGY